MSSLPEPYWQDEARGLWLFHGDSLEVMADLPSQSFGAILADPPYSSGTRREASKGVRRAMNRTTLDEKWFTSDCLTATGFAWLMRHSALAWKRLLVPGGHILVFIDWRMMPHLSAAIESADLRQAGLLVWNKGRIGMGACFRNQHELLLHFTNGHPLDPQRRDVGNVLTVAPVDNQHHPTEKPLALSELLLSVVAEPTLPVLDPYAGSGTTGAACAKLGLPCTMVEIDKGYCDIIRARLSEDLTYGSERTLFTPREED